MSDLLPKSKVRYESKATMCDSCDDCRHYRDKSCSQVEGPISPEGWCMIFTSKNPFKILGPAAESAKDKHEPPQTT